MFFWAFQGFLKLINANLGVQQNYELKGEVIDIEKIEEKSGHKSYVLQIVRSIEKDTVKLYVPFKNVEKGQYISKQLKVGSLGFVYSKN